MGVKVIVPEEDVLFELGDWSIQAELPAESYKGVQISSYIYHIPCGGCNSDANGWCSAWDVRQGECWYCKEKMPDEIRTVWVLLETDKLGNYMQKEDKPHVGHPGKV